jgi:hypothetical protein
VVPQVPDRVAAVTLLQHLKGGPPLLLQRVRDDGRLVCTYVTDSGETAYAFHAGILRLWTGPLTPIGGRLWS